MGLFQTNYFYGIFRKNVHEHRSVYKIHQERKGHFDDKITEKKQFVTAPFMDCWLNIYKPKGISSAKAVFWVKKLLNVKKAGHTGTLDVEAEGVLPIAVGQATKLVSILMDAQKQYEFTIQFGSRTDTADAAGVIIDKTDYVPTESECHDICKKFIGNIEQTPPAYSALKVKGVRAYKLARNNQEVVLKKRSVNIYDLKCLSYDAGKKTATFIADCSKGTYIRTLAEDISLSLQSLGFVINLRRTKVGIFAENFAVNIEDYVQMDFAEAKELLKSKCLKVEKVLDDIPVFDADNPLARKIIFGQKCYIPESHNHDLIWVRHNDRIIAIGSLHDNIFKSSRVFNYE